MNKDEIYNYIAEQQNSIEIFKQIKELVDKSETEQIRIKIETKHWYGYSEPFLQKLTHKIIATKADMNNLLDAMIKKERIEIEKATDRLIENRKKNRKKNRGSDLK